MKHLLLIITICIAFCKLSVAQNTIDIWVNQNEKSEVTKEKLRSDIEEYKNGIVQYHINPFTNVSKKEFYKAIDSLEASSDKCNIDELLVGLLKVNALINDEHTNLRYVFQMRFPLISYCFADGAYITATSSTNSDYMFSKVIAVNDIPIDKVLEKLATIVPSRNKGQALTFAGRNLFNPYLLHGLGISAERGSVTYTLITPKGDTVKLIPVMADEKFVPISNGINSEKFLRWWYNKRSYWFADTAHSIYFKYAACKNDPSDPLDTVISAMIREIEEKRAEKIIIDLRDNEGGNSALLEGFIDYLGKSGLNKKGGIFILVGRHTFSSAVVNAAKLKTKTEAIFVGEETGGSVNHFGEVKTFILPDTKIKVAYSNKFFSPIKHYDKPLQPDVAVPTFFADYIKYIDAPLQYAFTH